LQQVLSRTFHDNQQIIETAQVALEIRMIGIEYGFPFDMVSFQHAMLPQHEKSPLFKAGSFTVRAITMIILFNSLSQHGCITYKTAENFLLV